MKIVCHFIFLFSYVSCFCSATSPFIPVNAAPPSFPSSGYAFAQIAQPTTTSNQSINPSQLPCFQAYDFLCNALTVSSDEFSSGLISQVQINAITPSIDNTSFLQMEATIIQKTNQRLSGS